MMIVFHNDKKTSALLLFFLLFSLATSGCLSGSGSEKSPEGSPEPSQSVSNPPTPEEPPTSLNSPTPSQLPPPPKPPSPPVVNTPALKPQDLLAKKEAFQKKVDAAKTTIGKLVGGLLAKAEWGKSYQLQEKVIESTSNAYKTTQETLSFYSDLLDQDDSKVNIKKGVKDDFLLVLETTNDVILKPLHEAVLKKLEEFAAIGAKFGSNQPDERYFCQGLLNKRPCLNFLSGDEETSRRLLKQDFQMSHIDVFVGLSTMPSFSLPERGKTVSVSFVKGLDLFKQWMMKKNTPGQEDLSEDIAKIAQIETFLKTLDALFNPATSFPIQTSSPDRNFLQTVYYLNHSDGVGYRTTAILHHAQFLKNTEHILKNFSQTLEKEVEACANERPPELPVLQQIAENKEKLSGLSIEVAANRPDSTLSSLKTIQAFFPGLDQQRSEAGKTQLIRTTLQSMLAKPDSQLRALLSP